MLRTVFLLFIALPAIVAAETVTPGVSGSSYLQAGLALALIVALLLGTAWLARKVSGGKGFGQGGMKVVGGIALGPRERLVLVEVGENWLVIGIVPGQIRTLHSMPKGSLDSAGSSPTSDIPFASWLKSVSDRRSHE